MNEVQEKGGVLDIFKVLGYKEEITVDEKAEDDKWEGTVINDNEFG